MYYKNPNFYFTTHIFIYTRGYFTGNLDGGGEPRPLSKADKETKRKAHSFKRDPMTQTKLQSFFKKASNESESPTLSEFESDDDGNLIIDEESTGRYDDTTLKLEETDSMDTHNNTTLKINQSMEEQENKNNNSKTFVINITLKGIPSNDNKNKKDVSDIREKDDNEKINVKDTESPHKSQPVAKRKIKALFGDSSETDEELEKPKKKKHKDDKKEKKCKVEEKRSAKEHRKRNKHSSSKEKEFDKKDLFNNESGGESEKELVIDIESQKIGNESKDKLVSADKKSGDQKYDHRGKNPQNQSHSNDNKHDKSDSSIESYNSSILEMDMDDAELDKAHKLSKEADKVLLSLKQFAEQVHEPVVVESTKTEKKASPPSQPQETSQSSAKPRDKSKFKESTSKNKSSLSLNKPKDTYEHDKQKKTELKVEKSKKQSTTTKKIEIKVDKSKKEEMIAKKIEIKGEKPKKEEMIAKKTEKVDVAGLVVKLLMPYYKNKKISSRDLFKITARHIVHQLLAIQVTGKQTSHLMNFLNTHFGSYVHKILLCYYETKQNLKTLHIQFQLFIQDVRYNYNKLKQLNLLYQY